jgi:hypothetical protein
VISPYFCFISSEDTPALPRLVGGGGAAAWPDAGAAADAVEGVAGAAPRPPPPRPPPPRVLKMNLIGQEQEAMRASLSFSVQAAAWAAAASFGPRERLASATIDPWGKVVSFAHVGHLTRARPLDYFKSSGGAAFGCAAR